MADLLVALVHHPVYDKHGDVVTSAVTNIDVPDIARSCRTYGVAGFYVVTPVLAQRALIRRVMQHWEHDDQRDYNPSRNEALSLLRLEPDLEGVGIDVERRYGCLPLMFATSARRHPGSVTFGQMRARLEQDAAGIGRRKQEQKPEQEPEREQAQKHPPVHPKEPPQAPPHAPAEDRRARPWLMLLGTGSGLADTVLDRCEAVLEPLAGRHARGDGPSDYNHLSVRAAAAILLDRLRCPRY